MWTNTIGSVDPQAGSNSVIEASLNAPQFGGGRAARRAAAQEAVAQTGVYSLLVPLVGGDRCQKSQNTQDIAWLCYSGC